MILRRTTTRGPARNNPDASRHTVLLSTLSYDETNIYICWSVRVRKVVRSKKSSTTSICYVACARVQRRRIILIVWGNLTFFYMYGRSSRGPNRFYFVVLPRTVVWNNEKNAKSRRAIYNPYRNYETTFHITRVHTPRRCFVYYINVVFRHKFFTVFGGLRSRIIHF